MTFRDDDDDVHPSALVPTTTEELYGTPKSPADETAAQPAAESTRPPTPPLGTPTVEATRPPTPVLGVPTVSEPPLGADEPILPAAERLDDAVGAPKKRPKLADPEAPRGRKGMAIAAIAIVVGLVTATFIFLGHANTQRYMITCKTDQIRAEQGRAFPPWGSQLMSGPEWKPIPIPANAECNARETTEISELEHWYLDAIVERASESLVAPQLDAPSKPLDIAEAELHQALLLSRAPERRDQRKEVERLLGDVQYWRASLRLRDAAAALADAAKQFDAAAAQRPRHVTDAGAWASFLKKLTDELKAGPSGVPPAAVPVAPPTAVRAGVALPVEETPAPPPEATPDAGVPSGGVLL